MKIRLYKYIFLLSIPFIWFSCEDATKTVDRSLFGYEYFPLEVGKYWIYQVDSTLIINQGGDVRTSRTFVREEITESFIDASGILVHRLERSTSDKLNGIYQIKDVWTMETTNDAAFRTEENLRFTKITFPVNQDNSWIGNNFDNLVEVVVAGEMMWVYKDWGDYRINVKGKDRIVKGKLYNDVVSILQADHDFAIERRFAVEHYAPFVGLIEKEMAIFDTQCECPGQSWPEKANSGFTLKQSLIETN